MYIYDIHTKPKNTIYKNIVTETQQTPDTADTESRDRDADNKHSQKLIRNITGP